MIIQCAGMGQGRPSGLQMDDIGAGIKDGWSVILRLEWRKRLPITRLWVVARGRSSPGGRLGAPAAST
jgi:hypothetical protein